MPPTPASSWRSPPRTALLWVEGDRTACREVEAMNVVPGAD
jgi:hypothetical protein